MTAQMKLLHKHTDSKSYAISMREAQRLGVPVVLQRQLIGPDDVGNPETPAERHNRILMQMTADLEIERAKPGRPTLHAIGLRHALKHGLDLALLRSDAIEADLCAIRVDAYVEAAALGYSMEDIGDYFLRARGNVARALRLRNLKGCSE